MRTAVVNQSARMPPVMYVFEPFTTNSAPSGTAVVFSCATSDPAAGSVIPSEMLALPLMTAGTTVSRIDS